LSISIVIFKDFCKVSNFRRRDSAVARYLGHFRYRKIYANMETGKEMVNFFKECTSKKGKQENHTKVVSNIPQNKQRCI